MTFNFHSETERIGEVGTADSRLILVPLDNGLIGDLDIVLRQNGLDDAVHGPSDFPLPLLAFLSNVYSAHVAVPIVLKLYRIKFVGMLRPCH